MQFVTSKNIALRAFLLSFLSLFVASNSHSKPKFETKITDVTNTNLELSLYKQAESAINNHREEQFLALFNQLKNHPLADYLYRDWLIKQLSISPNSVNLKWKIHAFLKRNHTQVVSRKLRFRWLDYLANTNQHQQFTQDYVFQKSLKLRCRYLWLQLRDAAQPTDILPKITNLWLTGKSLPKHCDRLITLAKRKGILNQQLVWQRMLLAAERKQFQLVRYLNRMLPTEIQPTGLWLEKISRKPAWLKHGMPLNIRTSLAQDIILTGLNSLAWQKPNDTIKLWREYHAYLDLTLSQKQQLQKAIGLALAIGDSNDAKYWLQTILSLEDSSVKHWLLSRSLTKDDWRAVIDVTRKANLSSNPTDQWSYWHAISAKNIGEQLAYNQQLTAIADKRSYYGFLAAMKLDKTPNINQNKNKVSAKHIAELAEKTAAKRALALFELEKYSEARSEWNYFIQTLPKASYVAAAHLAHQWDWNHQSILAFAKSKELNDVEKRFPLFKVEQFTKATETHGIPLSWAYAIARQESAFKKDATSSAGAQGLMQLKPSTARRVARKKLRHTPIAKLSSQTIANKKLLHQPLLNIELGVAHLKEMLDYYQGNPILATAAYNAGSGRVDNWLKDNNISDALTWIEQIPFKETRDYVKNVLTYQVIYAEITSSNISFINNINNLQIPTNKKSSSQVSAR